MALVHGEVDPFRLGQAGIQNPGQNFSLFVPEQGFEGEDILPEISIQETDDLRQVPLGKHPGYFLKQGPVSLLSGEITDSARQVMVLEVQDPKKEVSRFLSNPRRESSPPDSQFQFARLQKLKVFPLDGITVNPVMLGIGFKDGADGIMGSHPLQVYHRWFHELLVDEAAVPVVGNIALGPLEPFEELGLQRGLPEFFRQLNRPARVPDDLNGFDSRKLIEEPAAARIHQHGMPLQLQKFEGRDPVRLRERRGGILLEKLLHLLRRTVEHDPDVVIPGRPRVAEERASPLLEGRGQLVPEPVQGLPQRSPPLLIPARVHPAVASAVAAPPLHPMAAAPGGVLENLHLLSWGVLFQELSVVRETGQLLLLQVLQRVGQGHIPEADDDGRRSLRRWRCGPAGARCDSLKIRPASLWANCSPLESSFSKATAREMGPS